ncbi:hypothetical protein FQ085_14770 [Planococcus sp. ANT_H30]|uniref:hypothetical protein n=1 Tax=Planococcus sp. ANT_H30 TaxID=2597347 RepID=UPI0011EC3D2B|nr:hypothetical protein [Planococcus sp. ANT_H30]KAA0956105.1 hypothetical protein FQ085_14770 [Planococcus sp. ANT_H30]
MQFTNKSLLILLSFLLVISLAVNIYSFTSEYSVDRGDLDEQKKAEAQYESELVEKEDTIASLQKELDANEVTAPVEVEEAEQAAPETGAEPDELINTAQRFIEYAFESDPESYATRKKLALNYMTESLYETLYPADGMDQEQQKISIEINEVNVFADGQNENEAIVHYTYSEEILSSGYEEEKEMYAKLLFTVEENLLKVAEIKPLENEYGGI